MGVVRYSVNHDVSKRTKPVPNNAGRGGTKKFRVPQNTASFCVGVAGRLDPGEDVRMMLEEDPGVAAEGEAFAVPG